MMLVTTVKTPDFLNEMGVFPVAVLRKEPYLLAKAKPPSLNTMQTLAEEVAKMEYERLSKEIVAIQDEANLLARYAVVAVAAVAVAVATKRPETAKYFWLLRFLPLLIAVLFSGRAASLFLRLQTISRYMEAQFEQEVLKKQFPFLGWETHLNGYIRRSPSLRVNPRGMVIVFWGCLWVLSILYVFFA